MISFFSNLFNRNKINNTIIKNYNLEGIRGNFLVKSVYDGDTITLCVPIKMIIYDMDDENNISKNPNSCDDIYINEIKVRLYGIDTPELKPSKNITDRENYISKAVEARDFLSNLILNKIITVEFMKNDKFGRPLAKIYFDDEYINDLMIKRGYALKYEGKTKIVDT